MNEATLENWINVIDAQPFIISQDTFQLMSNVTNIVGREKLIEWEYFAKDLHNRMSDDKVFPSVRVVGLVISCLIFTISLLLDKPTFISPITNEKDSQASRCMSLLLFVISLWITEAIPYFATAILIPILVVFLGVLKDLKNPHLSMTPEESASFCLDHIFNHTTMLILGQSVSRGIFSSLLNKFFHRWLHNFHSI